MRMGVGEFKARCLALIEDVYNGNGEVVLTKRGRPMARLVPTEEALALPVGRLAGLANLHEGQS